MFPNFFLVGAPKSGTTSLFYYLTGHPDVYMCPVKEPNYFSYPYIQRQNLYYTTSNVTSLNEYESLFDHVQNEKIVGEASVSYLFYKNVSARIKNSVPNAKVIILLRDPVERGFSHYLMDHRLGFISSSFEDVIYKRSSSPLLHLYYQQVVELGIYFHQVKRYVDSFGFEKVKIFLSEDLKNNNSSVMASVCEFLEIDPHIPLDSEKQYNVYRRPRNRIVRSLYSIKLLRSAGRSVIPVTSLDTIKNFFLIKEKKPELSPETRKYLVNFYKKDILKLSDFIGRDLSAWTLTA